MIEENKKLFDFNKYIPKLIKEIIQKMKLKELKLNLNKTAALKRKLNEWKRFFEIEKIIYNSKENKIIISVKMGVKVMGRWIIGPFEYDYELIKT